MARFLFFPYTMSMSPHIRKEEELGLHTLIYRHELYPEWIILKQVRDLAVKVHVDSTSVPEPIRLRQCTLKYEVMNASFSHDVQLSAKIGTVLDHMVLEVRKSGKFTETEIGLSFSKWILASPLGDVIMSRCKDEIVASKTSYGSVRPGADQGQDEHEDRPGRRRRM